MKEGIISNLTEIKSITKEYYEQLYANDLDNLKEVLVAQSCPTLWDPMDCSQPVSSVYGILQPWILEWVAIKFLERNELCARQHSHDIIDQHSRMQMSPRQMPGGSWAKDPV